MRIQDLDALQIFDSRGNPTLEAFVTLDDGTVGRGLVPSGASTGSREAVELRDGDPARFRGLSVFRAIDQLRTEIRHALLGLTPTDQTGIDRRLIQLDGTPTKARLGANAILAASMAVADAAARSLKIPLHHYLGDGKGTLLPMPEIQIVGGGRHAEGRIDVQDFMIVANGARSYEEALEMTFNVYCAARDLLRRQDRLRGVADEGGFWPIFSRNEEVLELILDAIRQAGYEPGLHISLSLDIAATELFHNGVYQLGLEQRSFSSQEFGQLLASWIRAYPIVAIEDPLAEEDWEGWRHFYREVGDKVQVIGDDLFVTNTQRIQRGMNERVANSALIKLNQVGTLTETLDSIRLCQQHGWRPVISARSGETEDAFISHLAVATNAGQIKVGSFSRSERMVKWNELLRIQRDLGPRARFGVHTLR